MVSASTAVATIPDWGKLFEAAQAQNGYFTTRQAASAGYSPQLLHKYLANGKALRVRRGIYRLVHFPPMEGEDLVVLWLWSEGMGVFSHQTALALHDLSDALPSKVHMTVPANWADRRLRVPGGLTLHYADLDPTEHDRLSAAPVTTPSRTLLDCLQANFAPDLLHQAIDQARRRGLISKSTEVRLLQSMETSGLAAVSG